MNKKPKENGEDREESTTQYGEFVATFDKFLTFEKQKQTAHTLENIGKSKNKPE